MIIIAQLSLNFKNMIQILHNPRCRKSRETLALIEEAGIKPEIVLYLEDSPSKSRLTEIADLLGMKPIEFTRTKEAAFKEAGLSKESSDKDVIDAMAKFPILIERPIVIKDSKKAVLGRPPENVKDLL